MPYELGVDLGTTFTAAAVRDGGEPAMVGLGNRALQVPSVLFWTGSAFLVGEAAERRGAAEPRRLVREFKRRLGDPVPVLVDGVPFSAESLSATLLRWVVDAVTRRQGEPPAGLVLTHPASWGEYKLDVLRQVVTLAEVGLPARWCAEPVAAAGQYAGRSRVAVGERLGVYDLGGGTFDACVLEKTATGFVMLGPAEGVEHLGGVDFDEAVFEQVRAALGDRLAALDPEDPETTAALARLRRECVEAKEALSVDAETAVPVALPGLLTTVRVTRGDLEQLIGPAVQQTVTATARAIKAAGVEPHDLRGIVLVGGSSRIPLVGEVLQQTFEVPVALDTHPKHDVALGALRGSTDVPVRGGTVRPPAAGSRPSRDPVVGTPAAAAAPGPATPAPSASPLPPRVEAVRDDGRPGAGVTGPPELLAAGPGDDGPAAPRRARLLVGALAVLLIVVLAVVVVPRLVGRPAAPGAALPAPASDSPSTSPSPTPSTSAGVALPQSTALTDDQLLVSMPVDGNTDLYLASTSSPQAVRRLTRGAEVDAYPVVSPDRRTVIYQQVSAGNRSLRVAGAADGSGDRPLVDHVPKPCAKSMGRPAWNPVRPDVLAVVCVSAADDIGLYLVRTDGSLVSRIPLPGVAVGDPTFSPDGARLAFWSAARRDWNAGDIYVVPADGSGTPTKLTASTLPTQYADPAFSPDGLSVAYRRRDPGATPEGDAHVYVVNADGSGSPRPLAVTKGANEQDPSYSPRGDEIAYLSDREAPGLPGGVNRVWVMGSDGRDQRVLLTQDAAGGQTSVSWTPR